MERKRELRLRSVRRALDEAEKRAEILVRTLKSAPRWYRSNLDLRSLSPAERAEADPLHKANETLRQVLNARERLEQERHALEHKLVDPSDCEGQAIRWLNSARSFEALVSTFRSDPIRTVRTGKELKLEVEVAKKILKARDAQPRRQFTRLADVGHVAKIDTALLQDLEYSGCWGTHEKPDIGVLLPLFIQTRFKWRKNRWDLHILVTPDRVFFCEHDPLVSETEVAALDRLWNACDGDIASEAGREAFRWLASALGGGRASWLCREFPPKQGETGLWSTRTPKRMRHGKEPPFRSQVRGLPSTLEVWIARGGSAAKKAAQMNVHVDEIAAASPKRREMLTRFSVAKEVGLATTIDLGAHADDIDAIYVVGTSTESPAELFESHRDSGDLAILSVGTPTNSVPGHPTPDLREDADHWWRLARGQGDPNSELVSHAIAGHPQRLNALPGLSRDHQGPQRALMKALWPALWGYPTKTLWGLDESQVAEARDWAAEHVLPEGPVPPIRVGAQPYGILPISAWGSWVAADQDPGIETELLPSWRHLLSFAAQRGKLAGPPWDKSDTASLVQRLARTASSCDYAVRRGYPIDFATLVASIHSHHADPAEARKAWANADENILELTAAQPIVTFPAAAPIKVPLVKATNLPKEKALADFFSDLVKRNWLEFRASQRGGELPNCLLFQLILYAKLVVEAEVVHETLGVSVPQELVATDSHDPTMLERAADLYQYSPGGITPSQQADDRHRWAIDELRKVDIEELERCFPAVLDTALYRVDPFFTGMAWRRARDKLAAGAQPRVGAYGWVDEPRPGTLVPTDGGLVVAPSHNQLVTAVVARDAAVREPGRWRLHLDSVVVRTALEIAQQVSRGLHISEAIGYRIEALLRDWADVKTLRSAYPIGDGSPVCDGLAVLESSAAALATIGANEKVTAAVEHLKLALEAYSDLGLLDGVHKLVQGRDEAAGAAMEAVAGLGPPPSLDVVMTPSSGSRVTTTVFVVCEPAPVLPGASPAVLAEPALPSLLSHLDGADLRWHLGGDTLTLADLNLELVDLAVIAPDELERILAWNTGEVTLDPSSPGLRAHRQITMWARAVQCEPAHENAFAFTDDELTREELWDRLQALVSAASAFTVQLTSFNGVVNRTLLARIAKWGIRTSPSNKVTGEDISASARSELLVRLDKVSEMTQEHPLDELSGAVRSLAVGVSSLPLLSMGVTKQVANTFGNAPNISVKDSWLPVMAATQARLAALESALNGQVLGELPSGFTSWTSLPGDPWSLPESKNVYVAFGPSGALTGSTGRVALGVLDGWSDDVPNVSRVGHAAFGFRAPPARPPQAILVAVPPVPDKAISTSTIVEMLADLRNMIRARAIRPEDAGTAPDYLPTAVLPERYFDIR